MDDLQPTTVSERFLVMLNERVGSLETAMLKLTMMIEDVRDQLTTVYIKFELPYTIRKEERLEHFAKFASTVAGCCDLARMHVFTFGYYAPRICLELKTKVILERFIYDLNTVSRIHVKEPSRSSLNHLLSLKRAEWDQYMVFDGTGGLESNELKPHE